MRPTSSGPQPQLQAQHHWLRGLWGSCGAYRGGAGRTEVFAGLFRFVCGRLWFACETSCALVVVVVVVHDSVRDAVSRVPQQIATRRLGHVQKCIFPNVYFPGFRRSVSPVTVGKRYLRMTSGKWFRRSVSPVTVCKKNLLKQWSKPALYSPYTALTAPKKDTLTKLMGSVGGGCNLRPVASQKLVANFWAQQWRHTKSRFKVRAKGSRSKYTLPRGSRSLSKVKDDDRRL